MSFIINCRHCKVDFTSHRSIEVFCSPCRKPRPCKCGCGQLVKKPGGEYAYSCRQKKQPYLNICKFCNIQFSSCLDHAKICKNCKKPKLCKCGCDKLVKKPGSEYFGDHDSENLRYNCICEICSTQFTSFLQKTKYCKTCRKPHPCICGCGQILKKPTGKYYSLGCKKKVKGVITKIRKFNKKCILCKQSHKVADQKARYCLECLKPRLCKCGCGKLVKKPGKEYYGNCNRRGKNYEEIYGTNIPNCGFKKGEANVAKRPEVKAKIFAALKKNFESGKCFLHKCKNSKGEMFRSSYEVLFSEFLIKHGYDYKYEEHIVMNEDKHKFIDFTVQGVRIEVTGFAFPSWQESFLERMNLLRQSIPNVILILASNTKYEEVLERLHHKLQEQGINIVVGKLFDPKDKKCEKRLLEKLRFCLRLQLYQKYSDEELIEKYEKKEIDNKTYKILK